MRTHSNNGLYCIIQSFSSEAIEELYAGIELACKNYKVDLVGGDTDSTKGPIILLRQWASPKGKLLIVRGQTQRLTRGEGDFRSYMGLQLLEREKRFLK